jgi:hypothetical protein
MGNFNCLVKEDFILNNSYVCTPCNIDQRQDTFYGHSKDCRHTYVAYGPCRDKGSAFAHTPKQCSACSNLPDYEEGDGKISFHGGCRYRTYTEDYEVVFANTDKELRIRLLDNYYRAFRVVGELIRSTSQNEFL